jgi:hypothetical protein
VEQSAPDVPETNSQIELACQSLVYVPDRCAAVGAEGSRNAWGTRIGFGLAAGEHDLFGAISNPDIERTANCTAAIVVVIRAYPKRFAARFSLYSAAEAVGPFDPFAHASCYSIDARDENPPTPRG